MTFPSGRAVLAWAATMVVLGLLDGWVGLMVGMGIASVLVAGFPTRSLGWLGVAAWIAVPLEVVVHGLPKRSQVAPSFVSGNLVAHHLAFTGFALLVVSAVLARPPEPHPLVDRGPDPGPLGLASARVRWALLAAVAVGALVASAAVVRS
ncbi:MAG: hypothetical protein JWN46_225 [Acidimicrobiales bacterium]|nr:hypothetical protein [Acidimicrobiales bacterium]